MEGFDYICLQHREKTMPQKKITKVYRTNLFQVGIGQGQMEMLPYLFSITEYDRKGQTLQQGSYTAEGLLAEKMAWEYNDQGEVVKEYYYSDGDEPSETVTYERDAGGAARQSVRQYLDGSEDTTHYVYDEAGHLTEKNTVDDEGVQDMRELFKWKGDHMVLHEVTDGEQNRISLDEYKYDSRGNIKEHQRTDLETGEEFRKVFHWDESNRKSGEEWYDREGNLVEKSVFHLDGEGRIERAETVSAERESVTEYRYDSRGNNTVVEETSGEGDQLLWVEHTWDNEGNLTGSVVFVSPQKARYGQHYKLSFEYEWFGEED